MSLYFPVPEWTRQSYKEGMRQFGWRRNGGRRLHAGCDIYAPLNSIVKAIAAGTVVENAYFYLETYQLSVYHPGIGTVRYGEIVQIPRELAVRKPVEAGMTIGKIGRLQGISFTMLHFELYEGTATGSLTNKENTKDYLHVPVGPYLRRRDLKDPTQLLDRLVVEGKK